MRRRRASRAHTEEILGGAGYTPAEIAEMKKKGIV